MKKLFFFVFITFVIVSCKKNDDDVELYLDYYPLEEGVFVEYDVTFIKHNPVSDTFHYRLKTVIGDTIIDNSGRIARKFYRYIYDTLYEEYQIKDLWTTIIDNYKAELVVENQRKIKLVFAPTADKEWNVNAFNLDTALNAYYENIHDSYSFAGYDFEKTVKVVHEYAKPNLIQYKNKYEVYAKGIGLIELNYVDIEFENFQVDKPNDGTELYYKIINYGR
jgi:hypothetical protein